MQIIQSRPTEESLRARAFNNSLNQAIQHGSRAFRSIQEAEDRTLRQQALEEQQRMEDLNFAQTLSGQTGVQVTPDQVSQYRELGTLTDMTGQESPLAKALGIKSRMQQEKLRETRADRKRKREVEGLQAEKLRAEVNKLNNPENENIKEFQKVSRERGVPGFQIANPNIIPTGKDQEQLKVQTEATKNIIKTAQNLASALESAGGPTSGLGLTSKDRNVGQFKRQLQLQMKELFNLGVLNGPDLDLLDDALGRIQGPIDQFVVDKSEAVEQINNVIQDALNRVATSAETRGYSPTENNIVNTTKLLNTGGENAQLIGVNDSMNGGYDPNKPMIENIIPSAMATGQADLKAVPQQSLVMRREELLRKAKGQ